DVLVTPEQLQQKHLLTMVFGQSRDQVRGFYNGIESTEALIHVGNAPDLGEVPRLVSLGGWEPNVSTNMNVHRMSLFLESFDSGKIHDAGHLIASQSGIDYMATSNGDDGGGSGTVTYTSLMASGGVFRNSCVACHSAAVANGGFNIEDY